MLIQTSRFGPIEVEPGVILQFPRGLIGFPHWNRFVLLPHGPESPFGFLQSVDDPDLALTVIDPRQVEPGYLARVRAAEVAEIGLNTPEQADQAVVLAVVTIPRDVRRATVNLLAPLIINPANRQGVQVVLEGSSYSVRYPLFPHSEQPPRPGSRLALVGSPGQS